MPNESFYDNTNQTLYIKIINNNANFYLHLINELKNHDIKNIILDLKEATNDISIDFLLEKLKSFANVISLVKNDISPQLLTKIQEVSNTTINYENLAFRDEKQKEDFEKDITTNLLNLPLEKVERLIEPNKDKYNDSIALYYIDLIIEDYFDYLDEDITTRLKNAVINLRGLDDKELIRKLFSSLINMPFSSKLSFEDNANLKEGLIDLCVIDFTKKHGIMLDYETKYTRYIIFLRNKLLTLGNKEDEQKLIFKGNIDQIITNTSSDEETFKEELNNVKNHTTDFEILIHNISILSPNNMVNLEKILLKLSSRVDSETEALTTINNTINEIMPELSEQTNELINEYLNNNSMSLAA